MKRNERLVRLPPEDASFLRRCMRDAATEQELLWGFKVVRTPLEGLQCRLLATKLGSVQNDRLWLSAADLTRLMDACEHRPDLEDRLDKERDCLLP